ncbi:MAG: hypothetical protein ACXVEF_35550 [Polyangiales bacterium]
MRVVALGLTVVLLAACSANSSSGGEGTPKTDSGPIGSETGATDSGMPSEGGIDIDGALPDSGPDPAPPSAVYAHSSDTLYKLDPDTKAVTVVGKFDGCSSVVDIALDAKSNLYASAGGIYKVDTKTAKCTSVGGGSFAGNSLSFIPAGILDPTQEVLVTYNGGTYYKVDVSSGATTELGSLPSGYSSSGDIVSVKGGGTYVTVNGNGCGDCLLEVNPKDGSMKKNWGSVGASQVFGIAFWAGSVYTFDNSGQIFELTFGTDKVTAKNIPIPSKPAGLQFWGAGSTTSAPIKVK